MSSAHIDAGHAGVPVLMSPRPARNLQAAIRLIASAPVWEDASCSTRIVDLNLS
jgi:hypothetical protein